MKPDITGEQAKALAKYLEDNGNTTVRVLASAEMYYSNTSSCYYIPAYDKTQQINNFRASDTNKPTGNFYYVSK